MKLHTSYLRNVALVLLTAVAAFFNRMSGQRGLENIIVEKYYVSGASDSSNGPFYGKLKPGSVTYRIFVDMQPGYRFYAAYGSEGHEMKIRTSTVFFNNTYMGNTTPNVIPRRSMGKNTIMLDSWLSVGAAGEQIYGVLKEEDDSINTVVPEAGYLQAKNKMTGIPLNKRDGLLYADQVPWPSFFGIDSLLPVFFKKNIGSEFITSDGAWGCLGGSVGPDSLGTNKVLIAQLTTDGELNFEINIQIGKPNVSIERYVARNPGADEQVFPGLIYSSRTASLSEKNAKPTATRASVNQDNKKHNK